MNKGKIRGSLTMADGNVDPVGFGSSSSRKSGSEGSYERSQEDNGDYGRSIDHPSEITVKE